MPALKPHTQYFPPEWNDEGFTVGPLEPLDDDHVIQRLFHDKRLVGFNDNHRRTDGTWCSGYVAFEAFKVFVKSGHQLISEDPLHVEPSLGCRSCPSHGFIREGRWINA